MVPGPFSVPCSLWMARLTATVRRHQPSSDVTLCDGESILPAHHPVRARIPQRGGQDLPSANVAEPKRSIPATAKVESRQHVLEIIDWQASRAEHSRSCGLPTLHFLQASVLQDLPF